MSALIKEVTKEMVVGIFGYLVICGLSAILIFGWKLTINNYGITKDIPEVILLFAALFVVGPVLEEITKMVALHRYRVKFYPLIIGSIELFQYVAFLGASIFIRIPALIMHVYTGKIHCRYSATNPMKGLILAIGIHQLFNTVIGLVISIIFKYIM